MSISDYEKFKTFKKNKKEIQYAEYLETDLFNKKIKDIKYHGSWQSFIREAISEKIDRLRYPEES